MVMQHIHTHCITMHWGTTHGNNTVIYECNYCINAMYCSILCHTELHVNTICHHIFWFIQYTLESNHIILFCIGYSCTV